MVGANKFDVIVVGAGLAGLRCAQLLGESGRAVLLVDRSPFVGGRLHSFSVDGYVIDEGFQLIHPSYPELINAGVLEGFDLRTFDPAIKFVGNGQDFTLADPRRFPLQAFAGFRRSPLSVRDGISLALVIIRARMTRAASLATGPDCTTREGLLNAGISESAVDAVLKPFLRGTFLDDNLETSWRYAQLILKSFSKANPGTHPRGIEELAKAFIQKSTGVTLQLNTTVTKVESTVVATDQGEFTAPRVVVAVDGSSATGLLGTPEVQWRPQTTWWWSLPKLTDTSSLRIDRDDHLLSSALDLSSRAPERSPVERSLVASPMNGNHPTTELELRARQSVARLYDLQPPEVQLVTTTVVSRALPATGAPLTISSGHEINGVYYAGDYLETPSIQGALASGAKAARMVLRSHS